MEVLQPYSNHNAGSIAFGNDEMLYITLGDGGSANDPQGNSQKFAIIIRFNLEELMYLTVLSKIHIPYHLIIHLSVIKM